MAKNYNNESIYNTYPCLPMTTKWDINESEKYYNLDY